MKHQRTTADEVVVLAALDWLRDVLRHVCWPWWQPRWLFPHVGEEMTEHMIATDELAALAPIRRKVAARAAARDTDRVAAWVAARAAARDTDRVAAWAAARDASQEPQG